MPKISPSFLTATAPPESNAPTRPHVHPPVAIVVVFVVIIFIRTSAVIRDRSVWTTINGIVGASFLSHLRFFNIIKVQWLIYLLESKKNTIIAVLK